MSKRQKRRTVSMSAAAFQRVKNLARRRGESISGMVQRVMLEYADREGEPEPETIDHLREPAKGPRIDHGQHFTF